MKKLFIIFIYMLFLIIYQINCDSIFDSDPSDELLICNQTTKLILPDAVDKEVIETNINNYDIVTYCWNENTNQLFLKLETTNKYTPTNDVMQREKNKSFVGCFNSTGELIYKFADDQNTKPGNIMDCVFLRCHDNILYALDSNRRITEYNVQDSLNYQGMIDSESLLNGYQFDIMDNKMIGVGLSNFLENSFYTGCICDIINDPEYDEMRILANPKPIMNIEKDWNYYNFLEIITKPMKLAGLDWDSNDIATQSVYLSMWTGGLFFQSIFVPFDDTSFLCVSPMCTEVIHYNTLGDSLNSYSLNTIKEYRKKEMERLGEKFSMDNLNVIFSVPRFLFFDADNNNILIFYLFSHQEQRFYNLKNRLQLLVYSIDDGKELLPLINVDFIPITFAEGNIKGIKYIDGQLYLCDYKLDNLDK